jgi:hypothetical protein
VDALFQLTTNGLQNVKLADNASNAVSINPTDSAKASA